MVCLFKVCIDIIVQPKAKFHTEAYQVNKTYNYTEEFYLAFESVVDIKTWTEWEKEKDCIKE